MIILGLDPGYEHSALVLWDGQEVVWHADEPNNRILERLRGLHEHGDILVIEHVESYGMAVGKTIFETVYFAGRCAEAWFPKLVSRVPRREIKVHLCGSTRATDSNIRQALIDRFGPSTDKAIGRKASPGPMYQITGHKLSALAVALTWWDQHRDDPVGEVIRPGIVAEF